MSRTTPTASLIKGPALLTDTACVFCRTSTDEALPVLGHTPQLYVAMHDRCREKVLANSLDFGPGAFIDALVVALVESRRDLLNFALDREATLLWSLSKQNIVVAFAKGEGSNFIV